METKKIKLHKSKGLTYNNQDNTLNIDLESNNKLLPINDLKGVVNQYEQYLKEKDESNKFRLIFTIKPYCTNILFNHLTECFDEKNENLYVSYLPNNTYSGDDDIKYYNIFKMGGTGSTVSDKVLLTRDTGYSHPNLGNLNYRCGIDIFNNHHLRRKEFIVINKPKDSCERFNTLYDIIRDPDGEVQKIYTSSDGTGNSMHIYNIENQFSLLEAVDANMIEENGWLGFKNSAILDIDNVFIKKENEPVKGYCVNKVINNRNNCDFIDMFPDRSYYTFVPKWNNKYHRLEQNWDYCLTYPYENDETNEIVSKQHNNKVFNGLYAEEIKVNNDDLHVWLHTDIKHTLKPGDFVKIDALWEDGYISIPYQIEVNSVERDGVYDGYCFSVRYDEISFIFKKALTHDLEYRVRKVEDGVECKYYLRKFRKIPCFKNMNVLQSDGVTEGQIKDAIENNSFDNTINQLGFSKTIYGDDITQILYNDDVDTTGLVDNLGREISEIYLTIVKRNKGYEEVYNNNVDFKEIERSSCFGKVTSGVSKPYYTLNDKYNVHKLHNINTTINDFIPKSPESLEGDITIDNEWFYGDVIELSVNSLTETRLDYIYHRFNTNQREHEFGDTFRLIEDVIENDDYDGNFNAQEKNLMTNENKTKDYPANLGVEGYYYQPHYPIIIKEFNTEVHSGYHTIIPVKNSINNVIELERTGYFNVGDIVYVYNKETKQRIEEQILEVSGLTITINFNFDKEKDILMKPNPIKPISSYDLKDETGKYIWRNTKKTIELTNDSQLYSDVFTNGAHYTHKQINFYLKRQDPHGLYKMYPTTKEALDIYGKLEYDGLSKDVTKGEYVEVINDLNC